MERGYWYTIKEGDNLTKIAESHLGNTKWRRVWRHEKNTKRRGTKIKKKDGSLEWPEGEHTDPDVIPVGGKLWLPGLNPYTCNVWLPEDTAAAMKITLGHVAKITRYPRFFQRNGEKKEFSVTYDLTPKWLYCDPWSGEIPTPEKVELWAQGMNTGTDWKIADLPTKPGIGLKTRWEDVTDEKYKEDWQYQLIIKATVDGEEFQSLGYASHIFDARFYWTARELDVELAKIGNHHYLLIEMDNKEACDSYRNQLKDDHKDSDPRCFLDGNGKYIFTVGGHQDPDTKRLVVISNQVADLNVILTDTGAQKNYKTDGEWEPKFVGKKEIKVPKGQTAESFLKSIVEKASYYVEYEKKNNQKYDLDDENCTAWMNSLLKAHGFTMKETEKLSLFKEGWDWGVNDFLKDQYFKK